MFQFVLDTAQFGIAANDHWVQTPESDEHPGMQHPFGIPTSNHRIYPLVNIQEAMETHHVHYSFNR